MKVLTAAACVIAGMAALIAAAVILEELSYVSAHPYAYGPAKVIAWAAGGGLLLSLSVMLLSAAQFRKANEA